ncbi:DUF2294 domain-containing protein [Peribacillus glennii]|uniref:DUF2294 family protein n=1 Tax=Peribacillus glennii TaxID=2303991 RepID=A0A372LG84_9BACI|nr:Na-translocating system protein MpsC family protein [Peribacillus glennii]RFU65079.1 DUF2294 family protein [Peribacillus glennii]
MRLNQKEKEIGSYIGRLLREYFGKGPGAVFAMVADPYITIYIKDFLTPMEHKFLKQDQNFTYVQKNRDMLMETLIPEITAYIRMNIGVDVKEFYYDWNLHTLSGMFVAVCSSDYSNLQNSYLNQELVHEEIVKVSEEAEKVPGEVISYLLNPRTLLIIRKKILVSIEKELISLGNQEILTIAKRKLEKRLLEHHKENFEMYLHARIENAFVAWDFDLDKSGIVFILQPK